MKHLKHFLSFFTNSFPGIGEKILHPLSASDILNCMLVWSEINDFIMDNPQLSSMFMIKAQIETGKSGITPLLLAVLNCQVEQVRRLCRYNDLLGMKTGDGYTPLHLAAAKLNVEIVHILCQHMTLEQIGATNAKGRTALHMACPCPSVYWNANGQWLREECDPFYTCQSMSFDQFGTCKQHIEVVKLLCKSMSSEQIQAVDAEGCTSLHYAVKQGYFEVVKVLFQNMAHEKWSLKDYNLALTNAATGKIDPTWLPAAGTMEYICTKGHLEILKYFCKTWSMKQINSEDQSNVTAIHQTSFAGKVESLKILRQYMPPGKFRIQGICGTTPLHRAACGGRIDVIQLLCQFINLDLEPHAVRPRSGTTPLHEAIHNGHQQRNVEVVKYFCKHLTMEQIGMKEIYWERRTALWHAASEGYADIVMILCQHMSQKQIETQCTDWQESALHIAAAKRHTAVVKILCGYVSVEHFGVPCQNGLIPLHYAASSGVVEMVEYLCQYMKKDQFFIEDAMGRLPLDNALIHGHQEIAEIICENMSIDWFGLPWIGFNFF